MVPSYRDIRETLVDRRENLARRIQAMENLAAPAAPRGGDSWVKVTAGESALEAWIMGNRSAIVRIDAALRRIEERTFDLCIHCGRAIPPYTLRAFPCTVTCSECSRSYGPSYIREISLQHDDIRKSLPALCEAVRAASLAESTGEATARCAEVAVALVRLLRREIVEHFEFEDGQGQRDDVQVAVPHLSGRVAALCQEHSVLLDGLDAIVARARQAAKEGAGWTLVERMVRDFTCELLEHEAAEREVLSDACFEDLGVGD